MPGYLIHRNAATHDPERYAHQIVSVERHSDDGAYHANHCTKSNERRRHEKWYSDTADAEQREWDAEMTVSLIVSIHRRIGPRKTAKV